MNTSILTLAGVFLLIAFRQIGRIRIQIWHAMLLGAVLVLLTGEISPADAWKSINLDVMLFLFGMFVVGHALEESGYLSHLSYKYFKRARTRDHLLLYVLFGSGIASAFLMNDTLAIVGTPVMLLLARKHLMPPKLLLLALCFGVTIGSVMSPIGNPQNLLIALNGGLVNPFVAFLTWLLVPTLINLYLTAIILKKLFPDDFHDAVLAHSQEPIRNHGLALLARISLITVVVLVCVKIVFAVTGIGFEFRLTTIALIAALPILAGSPRRFGIIRRIDWPTLVFFAAMFVLMESVWRSGVFQELIADMELDFRSVGTTIGVSVVLSQLVSNVPMVALYLPMLTLAGGGVRELMALAAGSTVAGNLLILGAASNVIIIHNAEKRGKETLSFFQFAAAGIPVTLVNVAVYWICILVTERLIALLLP